jgi:beta-glucosidase
VFESPYVDPDKAKAFIGHANHREIAKKAALKSITLLKNENNIAPIDINRVKIIAVIGPNANRFLLGGYSGVPVFFYDRV